MNTKRIALIWTIFFALLLLYGGFKAIDIGSDYFSIAIHKHVHYED